MKEKDPEIIIIGAAIIDVLVCPADEEVFRTGSYAAQDIRMSTGADALNEATVLARMGKNVMLETIIGDDKAGKYIKDHCEAAGIGVSEGCVRAGMATGINVVLIEKDGKRHFLANANGSLRKLCLKDIQMPFPKSAGIICFASIFVFPQIGPKELRLLFEQAKRQNKIVCADMTKCKNGETAEEMSEAFAYIDYLFPNHEEAMLSTGKSTVKEAARALIEIGVGNVIIKCGAKGCLVMNWKESYMVPAIECVECIDTTGAGDSFAAGFLYALSEGRTLRECAEYANRCGARAVGSVGATTWLETVDAAALNFKEL